MLRVIWLFVVAVFTSRCAACGEFVPCKLVEDNICPRCFKAREQLYAAANWKTGAEWEWV